jgi:hypothetical protein
MGDGAVQTSVKKIRMWPVNFIKNKLFLYTYNPSPKHFIIENFSKQA